MQRMFAFYRRLIRIMAYTRTGETISGEEGARAIYSMHIPRTQSSICTHGVRSTGHCGTVECVGELHDRKAL